MNHFHAFPQGPATFYQWEDFENEYTTSLVAASSPWVGAAISSGTFAQTTDEQFGIGVFSAASTTDNSGYQIQRDMETVADQKGRKLRYMARFKLSDVTESELFLGFAITTTILDGSGTLAAGITATDAIGLYKPDGEANIYMVNRWNSAQAVSGALNRTALVADTYYQVWFEVEPDQNTDGIGKIRYGGDGQQSGVLTVTTLPYDEVLTESIAFVSGNATGTKRASVDYTGCWIERVIGGFALGSTGSSGSGSSVFGTAPSPSPIA